MGSHARQPTGREREVAPRFAKVTQNRPPQTNTNGRHRCNGATNSSALYNDHLARNPRNSKSYNLNQNEAERPSTSAATRKQIEKTRKLLSKLGLDNSEELAVKLDELELRDDWYVVREVAKLIYEKAVEANSVGLTRSCAKLVYKFVSHQQSVQWALAKNLRKQLLDTCQQEFQKSRLEECRKATGQDVDDTREKEAKRKIGNARLLGEFYKFQWLTPRIMVEMVHTLLGRRDQTGKNCQESLYQLFELLVSVGKELESQLEDMSWKHQKQGASQLFVPEPNWMNKIFGQIKELENDKRLTEDSRLAMAILVKLWSNSWDWDKLNGHQRTSEEVPQSQATVEREQFPEELSEQENHEDFNVAISNRFQFLRSPPPPPPVQMDFYPEEQQSLYCGPTFFVPVEMADATEILHSPQLDNRILQHPDPRGIHHKYQEAEEAQEQPEISDTESPESILHHFVATINFENAEDLLLGELQGPDGFNKLVACVVGSVTSANSNKPVRQRAAEFMKALVESDRNSWTFKDIIAAIQQGPMEDITTAVEERPKAALHLTVFLAQVFSDQPRFSWVAQLASGLDDAETFSRAKSLEVLRNVVTVLSSMLRL